MKENPFHLHSPMTRRRALAFGAGLAGTLFAASTPLSALTRSGAAAIAPPQDAASSSSTSLPVKDIEKIIGAEGTVSNGVLSIQVDRNDLDHVVGPHGIPFKPSWEINHEFYFQSLGGGQAIFNGDICVLDRETNATKNRILDAGLVFMGFHQHFFDLRPQVWFQHFRGVGSPTQLAKAVRFVVDATSTRLPQPPSPKNTPLDPDKLAKILGGEANVEGDGVVVVDVTRKENITLGGHHVKSELGILHTIAFEPLENGDYCAVSPDFALLGSEVDPVFEVTKKFGFEAHCLYNQETNENPQFFFSHMLIRGHAEQRAREIREALNRTNSDFKS
jgi:Domain of Unknown Function (DUF1259)